MTTQLFDPREVTIHHRETRENHMIDSSETVTLRLNTVERQLITRLLHVERPTTEYLAAVAYSGDSESFERDSAKQQMITGLLGQIDAAYLATVLASRKSERS